MDDRFNTIAGWTLFGGIVALGLSSLSAHYFLADKEHRPETMGYAIEGVEEEGGAGAAAELPLPNLLAKADVKAGEALFAKCKACHTAEQGGANGIGPNLYGVVGEAVAAGRGGFAFSDALKAKGGKWDFESLDAWLKNPKAYADGTKMSFAGLPKGEDRANVIVYLNSLGSNLPLPAPVEVPAAGAAPAAVAVVGDAAKGEAIFAKCKACHTIDQGGANGIGPNLFAVYGEKVAGERGGFAFSDALKGKGGTWDDATLDAWLTSPAKFAQGTKMTFAGIADAQQRADVIAYMKTKK
ncbi:cytochrome c, class I [Novosphingobium aromaticivorans DSM 12444]|uniref:Cytochrome c, class I n=1 Tax=Novosphingobium aromaticivorans (strain ATCC 700278 / DSM 12444 / CCUG 56034 / CIP 105152 / NBRC 16084 / F199) TaxID=279238 RepID=Q2GB57_NOVAD|nr:cytochrome c, class I [Novosphingobium aromaticivorans DSM 12444]SCY94260.1 cytochrome c [Novosphingobium aromaticivorans]